MSTGLVQRFKSRVAGRPLAEHSSTVTHFAFWLFSAGSSDGVFCKSSANPQFFSYVVNYVSMNSVDGPRKILSKQAVGL